MSWISRLVIDLSPLRRSRDLRYLVSGQLISELGSQLTTVAAPALHVTETTVKRAEAPKVLEYNWGGFDIQWELEALGGGTRLTLWHNIDRRFIAWGAAGWHICFDVLDRLLSGTPIGRMAGADAMKIDAWKRLTAEYAKQFAGE